MQFRLRDPGDVTEYTIWSPDPGTTQAASTTSIYTAPFDGLLVPSAWDILWRVVVVGGNPDAADQVVTGIEFPQGQIR